MQNAQHHIDICIVIDQNNYYYAVEGYEIFTVDTSGAKDMYATGLYAKRSVSATPSITFSLSGILKHMCKNLNDCD